jgi:hypothetical protein
VERHDEANIAILRTRLKTKQNLKVFCKYKEMADEQGSGVAREHFC